MAAELLEQRQRLAVAVEATGLGFWEWDLGDGPMSWSDTNRAIYGIPAGEDVTIERYMALIHPEDRAMVSEAFAAARGRPEGGDFSAEFRITLPSGDLRWVAIHGRVSPDHAGGGMAVGTSLDITERKLAEDRRSLLMGELAHRAKNGIAVIMAIVGQTGRGMTSVEDFQTLLMSRLQAMANSQDLVMTSGGGGVVALDQVIARTVAPFGPARFGVDPGLEGVRVPGEIAVGMGLLLHELATNAAKYGALSGETGRVALKPLRAEDGRFAFEWREEGGPPVATSERKGFGTRLFQQVLRPQGGEVSVDFAKQGFRACVEFPIAR
jgi:PAS domain S-box-containing protein